MPSVRSSRLIFCLNKGALLILNKNVLKFMALKMRFSKIKVVELNDLKIGVRWLRKWSFAMRELQSMPSWDLGTSCLTALSLDTGHIKEGLRLAPYE